MNAAKSARAAATSETNALSSASAASTSAGNAKISETNASASASNAANSAKAAKQSEQNAKTWDPTSYTKSIILHKPDNSANNACIILGEIPNYYTYNNDQAGGSFSIYPYVRVGLNPQMNLSPAYCSISMPYNVVTNEGYVAWSTNANYVPVIIKNNETNKVYWGLSVRGPGHSAIIFGAFEHDINVITTLLSSSLEDIYDGWTILKKAKIKDPAGNDALFNYLHRIGTNPTLPTTNQELTALGVFMSYYWHNIIAHQPTQYGQIINLPADSSSELAQLWIAQTSGQMYHRGGNRGTPINDVPFTRFLDEDDATELEAKIPKKTSQLTNDSGFADTAALEAEAQKWKDAYNNLRKRSTPTAFDDDELTVLMDTPIGNSDITLSQPYTNFDGLLIYHTNDSGWEYASTYISSAEITRRKEESIKIERPGFSLINGRHFWGIRANSKFSDTFFPIDNDNCAIQRIYGVKFKEIT